MLQHLILSGKIQTSQSLEVMMLFSYIDSMVILKLSR